MAALNDFEFDTVISEPLQVIYIKKREKTLPPPKKKINEGQVPNQWKLANITSLYKNKGGQITVYKL